ncbi:MAG: polysaccharide deacetylase family protein [Elusimicrobia bacterium]|nr:polysaccharide deacetylase family protein [Elusimicrobiota bacterium]
MNAAIPLFYEIASVVSLLRNDIDGSHIMSIPLKTSFVVTRYEAIICILLMILTGSINSLPRDTGRAFPPQDRYPYCIALTFDDGPYPEYTQKLLSILENENAKATFFVIGRHVNRHPELIKQIHAAGHEIGGHTYNHLNITRLTPDALQNELEMTRKAIASATGARTYLFRPPGGQKNDRTLRFVHSLGYTSVLWTVLPRDHEASVTSEHIVKYVYERAHDMGIVLLHAGRQRTLAGLPEIIARLRMKGYRFVTISELLEEQEKRKG